MEQWLVWTIVGAIGLVTAFIIHALMKQAQGAALFVTLIMGIAGAFLAAWLLPRILDVGVMTLNEQRFFWAVIGSLVLSLLYEAASAASHRSRILIPAPGR